MDATAHLNLSQGSINPGRRATGESSLFSRASVMWAARIVDSPPPDRGHDEAGCQCTSHGPTPRNGDQGPIKPHEAPCSGLTGTPDGPPKTGRIVALARRRCAVHSGRQRRNPTRRQQSARSTHREAHAPTPPTNAAACGAPPGLGLLGLGLLTSRGAPERCVMVLFVWSRIIQIDPDLCSSLDLTI